MKKLFIALLAALLLAFAACAAPQQETAAPEPAQSEPASAVSWDDLTFDRTLPLQYATQFSVSYAGEDYTRLTIGDDQTFLVVAGDAPVPVPPPIPAAMKTMFAPRTMERMVSSDCSAAAFPTDGSPPAPNPSVTFSPLRCHHWR